MSETQNTAMEVEATVEQLELNQAPLVVDTELYSSESADQHDHVESTEQQEDCSVYCDAIPVEDHSTGSNACNESIDQQEDSAIVVNEFKQKTRPKKRNRAKAPASDSALHELVEQGITGKGLSTVTSRIKYVVIDDFRAIMGAMTRVEPDAARIDVLTHCHNCIHTAQGFTNVLFNAVPKLREADVNTSKSDTKIGTFSTVAHSFKLPRTDTHVQRMFNTLYTQFCHYQPKRGNPRDNKHVDLKAFRRGFRQILKTFPSNTMHGLVIFGDDKIYPTNWVEIEDVLEEILEQQDTTLTVFVPRSYAVTCTQKLDGKLAPFLRKVGLYL